MKREFLFAASMVFAISSCNNHAVHGVNMSAGTAYKNNEKANEKVVLPDGSQALLTSGSQLTLGPKFGISDRRVDIDGQAFFTVTSAAGNPFEVWTRNLQIKVLGTVFFVDAFRSVPGEEVDVLEGKVWVGKTYVSDTDNKPETAEAGEMVMINRDIDLMEKEKMNAEDMEKVKAKR